MEKITNKISKEEVYYFAKEVRKLLELLNGTTTICQDKSRAFSIENQMCKIENLSYKFEPTIYEEYSTKVKYAYKNMTRARKEYDRVVAEKCYKETIEEYKIAYENSVKEYERLKRYRNRLKSILK